MKQSRVVLSLFALLLTSLVSCTSINNSAKQASLEPENVKKVYVKPFTNTTNQSGLEVKFTNEVMDEIMKTSKLSLAYNEAEADAIIVATIVKYALEPYTKHDGEYKLSLTANVSLIDKDNNATLWADHDMEGTRIYKSLNKDSAKDSVDVVNNATTEEETRQIVFEKMSKKIVKSVIKTFESLSVSENKVSANVKKDCNCKGCSF